MQTVGKNSVANVKKNTTPDTKTCELSCKLTTSEFRHRKDVLIAGLKAKVTRRKELKNGYAFAFQGSDQVLEQLIEFIKAERECCDFFIFNLLTGSKEKDTWLTLKGPEGTKNFILNELGF